MPFEAIKYPVYLKQWEITISFVKCMVSGNYLTVPATFPRKCKTDTEATATTWRCCMQVMNFLVMCRLIAIGFKQFCHRAYIGYQIQCYHYLLFTELLEIIK